MTTLFMKTSYNSPSSGSQRETLFYNLFAKIIQNTSQVVGSETTKKVTLLEKFPKIFYLSLLKEGFLKMAGCFMTSF